MSKNSVFEGLEKFGFKNVSEMKLYENEKKEPVTEAAATEKKEFEVLDYIYPKSYECPVCYENFKSYAIKAKKISPISIDYDLRPIYKEPIQPMFYDTVICPNCGFAAVSANFSYLSEKQAEKIKEVITPKYKHVEYPAQLTVDMVIERYKIVLLNTAVKGGKSGEKAFICTKLAWLYRSKRDEENELMFMKTAYEGFINAYQNESMPINGLDEDTIKFMVSAFAVRLSQFDVALKFLSELITAPNVPRRIKDKAMDLKEIVRNTKK